jgi:hypothetical protein
MTARRLQSLPQFTPEVGAALSTLASSSHCYKCFIISGARDIFCAPRPLYTSSALGAGFLRCCDPAPAPRAMRAVVRYSHPSHGATRETWAAVLQAQKGGGLASAAL